MVETTQVQDVLRSWGWEVPAWSASAEHTLGFRVKPARFYRTVAQRLLARGDWRPTTRLVRTSENFKRPGELRHKATYITEDPFDLLLLGREPICPEVEQMLCYPGASTRRRATNTFQMFQALTHKDRLTQHLRAWSCEARVDAFLPLSFLVAPRSGRAEPLHGREDDQRDELLHADLGLRATEGEAVVWIAKEAFGCCGRRMLVSDRIEEILAHVDAHHVGDAGQCWVVQRYIHRPLLLHGHKFDIRCWVAIDPWLRVFAAQLERDDTDIELERDLVTPMHTIILQSIAAVLRASPPNYAGFQILGYDFMFDADLRCHLLEINFSPGAGRSLERLADDFIELAIDPLFPPTHGCIRERDNAFVRIDV